MKKKKLFSLVLATVLTAATVLPCYGASTKEKISNAQAEQAAAQSQLDSIQSRIDELNSKKGQSEEYLSELNQQLDDLQNRLQELQDQYDAKQNELVQIQADLEDAKAKEEEQYEAMKLRIQYMYENSSGNGYMAMLFSSKSISELISRAEYIQKISDFDRDLMHEYEDTVDQVKEKETQVQEEQAAIVELQQQSSDQQEAIQELYAAAYQELRTYSAELDDAKSSESALVDEINSKADAINDLIRQAKEEEIAAQKKAEEEAAAAAAVQQAAAEAEAFIAAQMEKQDSCGGIIECRIKNVPAGLGDTVFDKLDATLAHAIMSIGAVKAVEIGDGINVTRLTGSEDNDGFVQKDGIISKTSNHAGGIMGGMSDGSDIILRAHIKPTPSISQSQSTVTNTGENLELEIKGRHDPVIVPRAVVVVEAMAALTITDALFNNMSARMDRIHEFYQR